MLAQLKTHLVVHVDGQMLVEKMIDWKTHVQLRTHSNLGFKFDLRFLRMSKLLYIYFSWGIIYLIFVSLLHFRPVFPFYTRL